MLIVAAFGWGLGGVITRAAFDQGVDPVEFSAYRSGFAVAAMIVFMVFTRTPLPTNRSIWRSGLILGTVNLAAPFLLLTLAVVYASAGFVGLLVANIPIGTALWAHFLGDERLTRPKLIGLLVSFSGILVLLAAGDSGLGDEGNAPLAIALAVAGVCMMSFGILYAKRVLPGLDPAELALPQFAVGTVLLVLLVPFTDGLPGDFTMNGWLLVIAAGIVSTALPFVVFYYAMRHVSATQASLSGYMIPVVAIVLGAILLDERITTAIVAGGVLIVIGVVMTDRAAATDSGEAALTGPE
jgi:drug/metabolite transporter (DMT)-like permease